MASIKIVSRTSAWGAFGALALLLALGFLWLALEGQSAGAATGVEGRHLAPSTFPLPASGFIPRQTPTLWLPPLGTASTQQQLASPSGDNLIVLALSGSTALALAGLAFRFRRRRGVAPVGVALKNGYHRRVFYTSLPR